MTASGLYEGVVVHQRLRPRRHRLRYRIFQLLVDLDELPALGRRLRYFGHNRPALFSFLDRDHGTGEGGPLRPYVEAQLRAAGLDLKGGPIRILCMPRVLGQVFNPLTVYWCHRRDGVLAAVLYEVNNTFGQRHSYLLPVKEPAGPTIHQSCGKRFYVSPLQGMDMAYAFDLRPPGEDVFVAVRGADGAGPMLLATFKGERRELSDRAILTTFMSHPLLAAKVLAAIHWEALRIWLKGARFHPRPPLPPASVSIAARQAAKRLDLPGI